MTGPHSRNDVTNYCVQGPAFHITLWSLIKINRLLNKYKFRTGIIGEIYDCIDFDADPRERDDVIDLTVKVMTDDVRKHYPWINVPLVVEMEACPIDGNWYDKHVLARGPDGWAPADNAKWEKKHGAWI